MSPNKKNLKLNCNVSLHFDPQELSIRDNLRYSVPLGPQNLDDDYIHIYI